MRKVTIGDLGDIYTGNTPSKKNVEFYDSEDIMFIKPDILDFDINTINESNEYVSERAREKARIIPKDSLLVSCIGNIGKLGINKKEAAFNQQINAIVHNEKIVSSRYLAYLIKYNQKKLEAIANAPVVPIINKTQFSNFELFIHENLETQNKIVEVLDKAQYLIEKKKEQIELLDELVKSRFIEMFGDFDSNIYKFEKVKMNELCLKITDGTHKTPEYINEGIKFISAKDIKTGKVDLTNTKYISNEEYEVIQKRCQLKKGDILLSKSGSIGTPVILDTDEPLGIFESLAVLKIKEDLINNKYFCEFLKSDSVQRKILFGTKGVAIKHLHLNVLKDLDVVLPPIELQNEFAEFVTQTDSIRSKMETSLSELEDNFNSLMQKAFKGELF